MRVGVDIDGVLFPWTDVANEVAMERFGVPDPGPHHTWHWLKEQLATPQWRWLWSAEGQDIVFGEIHRTYPEAVDAVNAILHAGHAVHFVTHRDPRRTGVHTARFLELHFGRHPWAGVHVIQGSMKKHTLARWDAFVDDKTETVVDMLTQTKAQVFSPVRPYNGNLAVWDDVPRLTRYTDPSEIVEWLR